MAPIILIAGMRRLHRVLHNQQLVVSAHFCRYSEFSTASSQLTAYTADQQDNFQNKNFEDEFRKYHIMSTPLQKVLLSAGSAVISLLNPARADTIAIFGETSGDSSLKLMHAKMMSNEEGKSILQEKPRINSKTVDLEALKKLPTGTLGHAYIKFLDDNKVSPDSRLPVQFVDDAELAYVMQRYREAHDLIHTLLGMPTNMLGEVAVKWIEGLQTTLPMCVGGAIFGPLRFAPKQRLRYTRHYLPWAVQTGREAHFLLNVYWEQRWEQSVEELLSELNIQPFVETSIG